jgi:hypothetical protein
MPPESEDKPRDRSRGPTLFDPGPWVHPSHLFRRGGAAQASPTATSAAGPVAPAGAAHAVPPATVPAAVETAEELFQRLQALHAAGRVAIELDAKRLMTLDSPVNVEADGNQWVYGVIALSLVLGYAFGWKIGLATAAGGVVLYLTLGKATVHRRIRRRVHEKALADLAQWRKLWNYGGVTLTASGDAAQRCAAPKDNWLEFVRGQRRGD